MCGNNNAHPEHAGRLQSIWARLQETGIVQRCLRLRSRKATIEELQSVHSEAYTLLFGTDPIHRQRVDTNRFAELPMKNFVMLPCGGIGVDSDTTWNDIHTPFAARMAAGCVIDLAFKGKKNYRDGTLTIVLCRVGNGNMLLKIIEKKRKERQAKNETHARRRKEKQRLRGCRKNKRGAKEKGFPPS
jgi:acetoin utilization deacetylase AcuC-like enzyme